MKGSTYYNAHCKAEQKAQVLDELLTALRRAWVSENIKTTGMDDVYRLYYKRLSQSHKFRDRFYGILNNKPTAVTSEVI